MKQKTRISYWFLPVVALLFLALVGCVRPVPEPDVTATPENVVPVEVPTLAPATPLPDPAYPGTDGDVTETTPVTDPNAGLATAVPAEQKTHTVQDGETLDSMAQIYGVTSEEIAVANNLTTSSALVAGQVLVVPAPGSVVVTQPQEPQQPAQPAQPEPAVPGEKVHVVQPGENLFRISLGYGKTVDEVAAYNGIANPHYIYPGQVIRIP